MAKKEIIPGEMKNADIQYVSLVKSGAIQEKFKIFKSAEFKEGEEKTVGEPAKDQNPIVKGIMAVLEKAGVVKLDSTTPAPPPPSFDQTMAKVDFEDKMWNVFSTLRQTIGNILGSEADNKLTLVNQSIDQFRGYINNKITSVGITKAAEELASDGTQIEKAGRKISTDRLKSLKSMHDTLGQMITEAEAATNNEGGTNDVKKEELQAVLKEVFEPIETRLTKLEKSDEPEKPETGDTQTAEISKESLAEIMKETMQPLVERLDKIEKTRGLSNHIPAGEETTDTKTKVSKGEKAGFWGNNF
jgi:hypothetical protein